MGILNNFSRQRQDMLVMPPSKGRCMVGKELTLPEIVRLREDYRSSGQRVVFTNGCFDVLHRGHVDYLHAAKQLGTILVVGLNSDESISRLKGAGRPIVAEEDRVAVLSALTSVDHIVLFSEDTPILLIKAIRPDVLVKGGDYLPDEIVGAEAVRSYGGEVVVAPKTEGVSTSRIIERIARRCCQSASPAASLSHG